MDIEWFLQIYAQGTDSPLHSADYVAVHAYNDVGQTWYDGNDLPLVLDLYGRYAPAKQWIMTEVGLHTNETRAQKGERMAGLMHYGESSPVLPWNVWGFCYFHLKLDRDGNPVPGDRAAAYYGDGDSAYARRVNEGRLRRTPVGITGSRSGFRTRGATGPSTGCTRMASTPPATSTRSSRARRRRSASEGQEALHLAREEPRALRVGRRSRRLAARPSRAGDGRTEPPAGAPAGRSSSRRRERVTRSSL